MKYDAVIFDLGNTLVSYFSRRQWREQVFGECLDAVEQYLADEGLAVPSAGVLANRVAEVRREDDSLRFRPLADRMRHVFGLDGACPERDEAMARRFLVPVFARGRLHADSIPAIRELRRRGLKTGILSNTPWGSPAALWREELARHGLDAEVDAAAFCGDAGRRKPAPEAFHCILERLDAAPERSMFVGDDPRWDIAGPRSLGMEAVLIERNGPTEFDLSPYEPLHRICGLRELTEFTE
ncbi:MAG: HAD family hydrolase [Phycisphaerae bacterium]